MSKKPAASGLAKAGDVIKKIREEYNLTQSAMALRLGWEPSQLSRIECNRVPVTRRAIHEVARCLEIQPERLMLECLQAEYPSLRSNPIGEMLRNVISQLSEEDKEEDVPNEPRPTRII